MIQAFAGGSNSVSSLTVNPTSVIGGNNSTGTVTLSSAAPTGGITVSLQSSNTSVASVPPTVTVSAGSTSKTFTVTTYTVSSAQNVTLTASCDGTSANATLRVVPQPSLSSLSLNPNSLTGGSSSTGTVTLSSEAPSGGISVGLSSDNSAASVQSSVTVAAGATSANFPVTTTAVSQVQTANIKGTYNSGSQQAALTINPPALTGFTLNPSPTINGGQEVAATFTLNGPAPTGGASVAVTCSNTSAADFPAGSPPTFPTTMLVPAGSTTATWNIQTSTVNYPITITFTANYNAILNASLTLTQANLWVTDIYMPYTIKLAWNVSASGNFVLKRDGVTLSSNATSPYTDIFNPSFTSGQTYTYTLWDSGSASNQPLATECVVPYQANTNEDQTVDSRIDPRYSTLKYLDFQYGSMIYRGGLYVGYMNYPGAPTDSPPPDNSEVGRSFAKFPLTTSPSGGTFRAGDINAYFTGCNTDHGAASVPVGCQPLSTNSWVGSTLTWDSAPQLPQQYTGPAPVTVSSTDSPAIHWCYWPLSDTIKNTLNGSQLLSTAWVSTDESSLGWAYFAKQEYNSSEAPCALYAYDLPVPISLVFNPDIAPVGVSAYGYVTVNGLGPNDSVTVYISPGADVAEWGFEDDYPLVVTGLNNPAMFEGFIPISSGGPVTFTAKCNNVSVSGTLYPANP